MNLTPATDYPVNLGMACPKGWEALTPLRAPDRATTPLLRDARGKLRAGRLGPTRCETFTARFKAIQRAARPGVGRLARHRPDPHRGDGAPRARSPSSAWASCTATATRASAWPPRPSPTSSRSASTRRPSPTRDFEAVGRHRARRLEPLHRPPDHVGADVPQPAPARDHRRRSAQDRDGDGGHAALRARAQVGSDAALRPGPPAHRARLDRSSLRRRAHHRLRRASRRTSSRLPPSASPPTRACDASTLDELAETIHRGKRVSFWWTMGVNQSHEGVRTAQAIINLALITGNIGRPGTGANSITGQCNAMGSRLFSNTTNLFGGRDFTNADAPRAKSPSILGIDPRPHPRATQPRLRPDHRGILAGKINGAVGHRHQPRPFLDQPGRLLDDASAGSTSWSCRTCTRPPRRPQRADLVLPAAGWGEKEGTFINSERRIGVVKKVARAPGPGAGRLSHLSADRRRLGLRRAVPRWDDARRRCSRS